MRVLLAILIVANMTAIFLFSAESGEESEETSGKVAGVVASVFVRDYDRKTPEEQQQILKRIHRPLRKAAHMTEFGTLGAFAFLFLLTWVPSKRNADGIGTPNRIPNRAPDRTPNGTPDRAPDGAPDRAPDGAPDSAPNDSQNSGQRKTPPDKKAFPRWEIRFYFASLLFVFLYAATDEWHQSFSDARGPSFRDVLIDLSGAVLLCSLVLAVRLILQRKRKRRKAVVVTRYDSPALSGMHLKIAVAADLHGGDPEPVLKLLREEKPDLILIPGDLMEDTELKLQDASGYRFLRECAAMAPTYYSFGNHEIACYHKGNPWRHPTPVFPDAEIRRRIAETGAVLLDNDAAQLGNLWICGLTSGINGKKNEPDPSALSRFAALDGFRILLCHHPEYYEHWVRPTGIELTVCGHAHGGHWRFFGRGVYAPGQGLFPKNTAGMSDGGRCVISRGLGDHTRIPRIGNPRELVLICGSCAREETRPDETCSG